MNKRAPGLGGNALPSPKWTTLPDVVKQLRAEASYAAPQPRRGDESAAPSRRDDAPVRDDEDEVEVEDATSPGWPGLADYDELAAAEEPDARALFARLTRAADEALGARGRALRPLFNQLGARLDELLATPASAEVQATRRAALFAALDKLEDVFAALTVMP